MNWTLHDAIRWQVLRLCGPTSMVNERDHVVMRCTWADGYTAADHTPHEKAQVAEVEIDRLIQTGYLTKDERLWRTEAGDKLLDELNAERRRIKDRQAEASAALVSIVRNEGLSAPKACEQLWTIYNASGRPNGPSVNCLVDWIADQLRAEESWEPDEEDVMRSLLPPGPRI